MKEERKSSSKLNAFRFIPRSTRINVRTLAREAFIEESRKYSNPLDSAEDIAKDSLLSFSRKYKKSKEFKSILSVLLTAIIVRLATRLIEDWIDKHLFNSVGLIYQEDEPGFLEPSTDKK